MLSLRTKWKKCAMSLMSLQGLSVRQSECVQAKAQAILKKKFKDQKFAAGCSRDVIKFGAQLLEWDLDKLFEQTIIAMRSCDDGVKSESETLNIEL